MNKKDNAAYLEERENIVIISCLYTKMNYITISLYGGYIASQNANTNRNST